MHINCTVRGFKQLTGLSRIWQQARFFYILNFINIWSKSSPYLFSLVRKSDHISSFPCYNWCIISVYWIIDRLSGISALLFVNCLIQSSFIQIQALSFCTILSTQFRSHRCKCVNFIFTPSHHSYLFHMQNYIWHKCMQTLFPLERNEVSSNIQETSVI